MDGRGHFRQYQFPLDEELYINIWDYIQLLNLKIFGVFLNYSFLTKL